MQGYSSKIYYHYIGPTTTLIICIVESSDMKNISI